MPKVTDTRKQRAAALLATIVRGPAVDIGHYPATADEFFKAYGNWVRMIRSELIDLIPELRAANKTNDPNGLLNVRK